MNGLNSFSFPIGIIGFNRPENLKILLSSLYNQTTPVDFDNVFILLDGFHNSRAELLGINDETESLIHLIKNQFGISNLKILETNFGTALSFGALRKWIYSATNAPWVLLIEDDMELHSRYLEVTNQLINWAQLNSHVAQVSSFWNVDPRSRSNFGVYSSFGTKVFAENKHQFNKIKPDYELYLNIMQDFDYANRDTLEIQRRLLKAGLFTFQVQQDCVLQFLLNRHNLVHITTPFPLARDTGFLSANHNRSSVVGVNTFPTDVEIDQFMEFCEIGLDCLDEDVAQIRLISNEAEINQLLEIFKYSIEIHSIKSVSHRLLRLLYKKSLKSLEDLFTRKY